MSQINTSTATTGSLRILFDELGRQIQVQQDYGGRLDGDNSLFQNIKDAGWSHKIGGVTDEALADIDVLVLTNRVFQGYTLEELTTIVEFVRRGKGVWCMSNHAAFNAADVNQQMNNHVRYDSAVSTTFLTSYQAAAYQSSAGQPVQLEGMNLTQHPILLGNPAWPLAERRKTKHTPIHTPNAHTPTSEVRCVVTRSFCGVYQNPFTSTIVGLQGLGDVINFQYERELKTRAGAKFNAMPPVSEGVVWAVSLEGLDVTGKGRVVICADAGWLGNTDSKIPGRGEFQNGDNPQYALNTLAWLGQLG